MLRAHGNDFERFRSGVREQKAKVLVPCTFFVFITRVPSLI